MVDEIRQTLENWYLKNRRELPWRSDPSPYKVWLSEVILQQTRVDQGLPYFNDFLDHFPSIQALAAAHEDQILRLWQGLGYYSRARNLHAAANMVVDEFGGVFPNDYENIIKLKGVGQYTAAAIASIAFDKAHAVVDGNVIRVVARLYGIEEPVDETITKKTIHNLAEALLNKTNPSSHNQAMMEFGALQCIPKNPDCHTCVLRNACISYKKRIVDQVPKKKRKTKRSTRHFHYLIADFNGKTLIRQRLHRDIWQGLYEFPLIESAHKSELLPHYFESEFGMEVGVFYRVNAVAKHVLTHLDIYATFYHARLNDFKDDNFLYVSFDELHTFALPRLIDRYLEKHQQNGALKEQ